jgi:aminopeptidase
MEAWKATRNTLKCVLDAEKGESINIFCDDVKIEVGKAFEKGALKLGLKARLIVLKSGRKVFRTDIPKQAMEFLTTQRSDIYINLLRGIREETPFRIKLIKMQTKDHKTRLGHCPGVTLDMLTEGALALTSKEHRQMQAFADKLIEKLDQSVKVKIRNPAGTDASFIVEGRPFFTDTKMDWKTMNWMNLPTGEVIVAPVENSLQGKIVCDMAVGGIGPIQTPIEIETKNGEVQNASSADAQVLERVKDSLETDEMAKIIGEFAFGINPKARFVDEFLETEKMLGTIHVAFGNNSDMPEGKNNSKNHMDFLMSKPMVKVVNKHGSSINVLSNGVFEHL